MTETDGLLGGDDRVESLKEWYLDHTGPIAGAFYGVVGLLWLNHHGVSVAIHFLAGTYALMLPNVLKSALTDDDDESGLDIPAWINSKTPSWVNHEKWVTKVETERGKDRLERVAVSIPEKIYRHWARSAVLLVGAFVAVWTALLIIGTPIVAKKLVFAIWAIDFSSISQPQQAELAVDYVKVLKSGLALYLSYSVLFLLFLPGLLMHEFGHFAAFRRNEFNVDSFGLIFFGPLPLGAFVSTPDDAEFESNKVCREVISAGIIYNVVWGTVLLTAFSVLLAVNPTIASEIGAALQTNSGLQGLNNWVVFMIGFVGAGEIIVAVFNAAPVPKLDGGHYAESVIEDVKGLSWSSRGVSIENE